MKEEIIQEMERIIGLPDASESEILQRIKECYDTRIQKTMSVAEPTSISRLVNRQLDAITDNELPNNIIKTGFSKLDELIGGFAEGELVVIGGRPAMGKRQLLINMALNISRTIPVLFLSNNLSESVIASRCLALLTGIETQKVLMHSLDEEEIAILKEQEQNFGRLKLLVNSCLTTYIDHLKVHCIRQIKEIGIKVIMVDDLQTLNCELSHDTKESEIGMIIRTLKSLAREHNVCVIAASQMNRGVENRTGLFNKRPQLADLRESGAIEQDADKVIFIHRPEYFGFTEDEEGNSLVDIAGLIVAKNCTGRIGDIKMKKTPGFTKFEEIDSSCQF